MNLGFHESGFDESEICQWAEKYKKDNLGAYETESEFIAIKSKVQKRGYLDKEELLLVADWKVPPPHLKSKNQKDVKKNDDNYIKEITGWAFTATVERSRIEVLTLLNGIGRPIASAILHLFHKDRYPILDKQALWSVGVEAKPPYSFECWWKYVLFCRDVACHHQVCMRTLDRALWQYAKCKKPKCKQ